MIPHIAFSVPGSGFRVPGSFLTFRARLRRVLPSFDPPLEVRLAATSNPERPGRHILGDGRARRDVSAFADAHWRHQLAVAPDEGALFDDRLVLPLAVEIARNGPGADVHIGSDRRVAEIGQMACLRPGTKRGFLQLDEVANFGPLPN